MSLRQRRNTGMIGLRDHRRIDRRSLISRCRPHGPLNTPDCCHAANVSQAQLSLFGPESEMVYPHDQRGAVGRQATGQGPSKLARQLLLDPGRRRIAAVGAQGRNVDPDNADCEARLRQARRHPQRP